MGAREAAEKLHFAMTVFDDAERAALGTIAAMCSTPSLALMREMMPDVIARPLIAAIDKPEGLRQGRAAGMPLACRWRAGCGP